MFAITVVAKSVPTAYDLHALWATMTNKQNIPVRISQNGRLVKLIANFSPELVDITLPENTFTVKSVKQFSPSYEFTEGELVTVSGIVSYSHHVNGRYFCPVTFKGVIAPVKGMKDLVRQVFTRNLGVDVDYALSTGNFSASKLPSHTGKVQINDGFELIVTAPVVNASIVNQLETNAICRRKSYGYGAMDVCLA